MQNLSLPFSFYLSLFVFYLTYEYISCILKVNIIHGLEKELKIDCSEAVTT